MQYLLQVNPKRDIIDVEVFNVKYLLDTSSYFNEYKLLSLTELRTSKEDFSKWIPIGDLYFVGEWLKKYHNVLTMKPIEVPEVLRIEKYLHRDYNIVSFKDLELKGYKFIKDIDKLKQFSYIGNLELLDKFDKDLFISEHYLVSNIVDIVSEYRVFVSDLTIKAIQYYDGDCTIFSDISILREMIGKYYQVKDRPKSYTMDIGVLKTGETIIIEVHPVTSVGTYGYDNRDLLYMYEDGIKYYLGQNRFS